MTRAGASRPSFVLAVVSDFESDTRRLTRRHDRGRAPLGPVHSGGMEGEVGYTGADFYCDVALPHPERLTVVHDGSGVLAFHHIRPSYETHLVVVPKAHLTSLTTLTAADEPVVRELLEVVQEVARLVEHSHGAARVITNVGRYQESKHLHVHVVSGAPR